MVTLDSASLAPLVDVYRLPSSIRWNQLFHSKSLWPLCSHPVDVEIGFGIGETLIRMAQKYPKRDLIGIEQNWERISKTLREIQRLKLNNIRVLKIDARWAFQKYFREKSIDRVICLFPCPWLKTKHHKHRLFSRDFFGLLNNRLKDRGEFKVVTDNSSFFQWVLEEVKEAGFEIETKTSPSQYDTKFERKWVRAGQKDFFEINGRKTCHQGITVEKDPVMKSYLLKSFDPSGFRFLPVVTKDCSIIFKEMVFDPIQEKAMLHFVVSEDPLTQHFWVMIFKKGSRWQLCKADGQSFFQTHGTAQTLEWAYRRARETVQ